MSLVECGHAATTLDGQVASGDRGVVVPFRGGTLVAAIDGLGHGSDAAAAARAAEDVLAADPGAPVDELLRRCHVRLRRTRGAAMTLASFRTGEVTWLGVGNVEGVLLHGGRAEAVAMRGGTVGFVLPNLAPRTLGVGVGDTLVLATDGINHGFRTEVDARRAPQAIADAILDRWSKRTDDACVVVARYRGEAA